jgi:dienelactone hydrolase
MKKIICFLYTLLLVTSVSAQLKLVSYSDGDQKLNGFISNPKKPVKNKAGILILPAWKGIDDHSKEVALKLSDLGYHSFVADIYGEGNYPKDNKEAGQQAGYYKKNYEDYQRRIQLALDQLIKNGANKEKIVVIGYCFGGTGALEAARGNMSVLGVVSFHGGLGKADERNTSEIKPKVLVLHGANDPVVSDKEITNFQKEMKDANADWQMIYYANAVHSFTHKSAGNDSTKSSAYNELADKRSFIHFLSFLQEIL